VAFFSNLVGQVIFFGKNSTQEDIPYNSNKNHSKILHMTAAQFHRAAVAPGGR
jgi:hypothetical protein